MKNGPFRYDQVGSLLRTQVLKDAKDAYAKETLTYDEYKTIEREEIRKIVAKQKEIGLKAITDGEFNREYWHYDFISYLNGMETYTVDTGGSFQGVMSKLKSYFVKDHISFPKDHPFLDDFEFLDHLVGTDGVAKVTIPGPNMIYFSGAIKNPLFKEKSNISLQELEEDIIKVYQDAIQEFYKHGCRYLQLDDTSWGVLFCESQRQSLLEMEIDPLQLAKDFSRITTECIKQKPADMVLTTHCCRGNFKSSWLYEGDYEFVQEYIFKPPFDGFFLEFDDERSGSLKPISYVTHGKLILGLITSKDGRMEKEEVIKKRIQEASRYLPLDTLCLSCQCGFSSTEDGNIITEEEQYDKLKLVVDIAKEVWHDA